MALGAFVLHRDRSGTTRRTRRQAHISPRVRRGPIASVSLSQLSPCITHLAWHRNVESSGERAAHIPAAAEAGTARVSQRSTACDAPLLAPCCCAFSPMCMQSSIWWLQRGECAAERRQQAVGDFYTFNYHVKPSTPGQKSLVFEKALFSVFFSQKQESTCRFK